MPFSLFKNEGVTVGARGKRGALFVCAYLDLVKRAVVFAFTVMLALGNGAFNALVCVVRTVVFHKRPFHNRIGVNQKHVTGISCASIVWLFFFVFIPYGK